MSTPTLRRPIGGGGPAGDFWTVRDQYASVLMEQLVTGTAGLNSFPPEEVERQFAAVAKFSFMLADAMMKARST